MKKTLIASCALLLAACSSVFPEPQEPASPSASPTPATTQKPTSIPERDEPTFENPYAAGVEKGFSITDFGQPEIIAYDDDARVVLSGGSGTVLAGYEVLNSGMAIQKWHHNVAEEKRVLDFDTYDDVLYVQFGDQENAPLDIHSYDVTSGEEIAQWVNEDAPGSTTYFAGADDEGAFLVTTSATSATVERVDSSFELKDSVTLDLAHGELEFETKGLIRIFNEERSTYALLPELATIDSDLCRAADDGVVCVDDEVTEYDFSGNALRKTPLQEDSAGRVFTVVSSGLGLTTREYAKALTESVTGEGEALYYGGEWIARTDWKGVSEDILVVNSQVPYALDFTTNMLVNVVDGKAVNDEGTIGIMAYAPQGLTFFQLDDDGITHLRPLGRVNR